MQGSLTSTLVTPLRARGGTLTPAPHFEHVSHAAGGHSLGAAFALLMVYMARVRVDATPLPLFAGLISTSLRAPLRLCRIAAGGHSLGGAFALLMVCMARVRMDFDPTAIRCYAFGAPPVLSLSEKTAAQNVMSVST